MRPNLKGSPARASRKHRGPRRKGPLLPQSVRRMEKRLATTVGEASRLARMRAGLTQADVAERIGVATEVYGRMERGKMLPSISTLLRLCVVLRSGPDELMGLAPIHGAPERSPWASEVPAGLDDTPEMRRVLRTLRRMKRPQLKLMYLVATAILTRP
ncbi:helix-turn-helix transcriptional regulator [Stigmatella erecta]|uniref:helix-turn-helix transcriptional regulator n=1 Tax=Stigmatella erecta TaxID=83460 RepID=UPI001FE74F86|nr:helix-turn-helix transcriptional regulator [Stigmatella erecta]